LVRAAKMPFPVPRSVAWRSPAYQPFATIVNRHERFEVEV
jgi:hypothetical protein